MTKIVREIKYCKHCKKEYEVPVLLSTNSFFIERDPKLKKKAEEGTLFKNFCPVCKNEMVDVKDE